MEPGLRTKKDRKRKRRKGGGPRRLRKPGVNERARGGGTGGQTGRLDGENGRVETVMDREGMDGEKIRKEGGWREGLCRG